VDWVKLRRSALVWGLILLPVEIPVAGGIWESDFVQQAIFPAEFWAKKVESLTSETKSLRTQAPECYVGAANEIVRQASDLDRAGIDRSTANVIVHEQTKASKLVCDAVVELYRGKEEELRNAEAEAQRFAASR
jgi:hypothetical protein